MNFLLILCFIAIAIFNELKWMIFWGYVQVLSWLWNAQVLVKLFNFIYLEDLIKIISVFERIMLLVYFNSLLVTKTLMIFRIIDNCIDCSQLHGYYELRSFAQFAHYVYWTSHLLNQVLTDAQSQASSFLVNVLVLVQFGVVLEKFINVFLRDAYSTVFNNDLHLNILLLLL